MSYRIYIPDDSAALALGADDIANAIAQFAQEHDLDLQLVRNSSRGLFWA